MSPSHGPSATTDFMSTFVDVDPAALATAAALHTASSCSSVVSNRTYASIYGTAAIQLKDIPPRPTKYDGCVTLFNVPSADEASVSDDLSRFGEVVDVTLKAGQASVRFASHEQAERCVVGLHGRRTVDKSALRVRHSQKCLESL